MSNYLDSYQWNQESSHLKQYPDSAQNNFQMAAKMADNKWN